MKVVDREYMKDKREVRSVGIATATNQGDQCKMRLKKLVRLVGLVRRMRLMRLMRL